MRSRHFQVLAGITVLGALLRFLTLGDQSYWGDEGVTVAIVRGSFGDMLDTIPRSESTPPLFYVLAWGWTRLIGSSGEWGLRALPALAGTATIPVACAAASALVSRRAGLVTAALVACSPLLVWYSQESRAYAPLLLLTALSLWMFARVLDDRPRALLAWAVVAAVALATHYFSVFVIVPQAAWLLWRAPAGRRRVGVACACVAAVGALLLPLALEQRSTGNTAYIGEIPFSQRAKEVPKKFLVGEQASPGDYGTLVERLKWAGVLLALVAAGLLIARADARERRGALLAGGLAAAGFALPLLGAVVGLDYFAGYNLQALWLPLAIAAGAGFGARAAGRAGLVAAAAFCAVGVGVVAKVATDPHLQRYDYRGAAAHLPAGQPRAIVANPLNSITPLAAYRDGIDYLPPGQPVTEVVLLGMRSQDESTRARAFAPVAPSLPGFKQVERIDADTYTLIRLHADHPRRLDLNKLQRARLGTTEAALVLQR